MTNQPCRKELLNWINVVSFAVNDVRCRTGRLMQYGAST